MASSLTPSDVYIGASPLYQRAFYRYATVATTPLYLHLKTNIPKNSDIMFYIEADGFNFGRAQSTLCAWTGYPYSGSGTIISTSLTNWYTGMDAHGLYLSTDNYVVLRAYASTHYYNGFVLNAVMANPAGYDHKVQILAVAQVDNAGAHY